MHKFFMQNADLIAATPCLFTFFRCFFDGTPPSDDLYVDFVSALEVGTIPQCGFIVDESQVNFWFNFVIVGCVLLFCFVCVREVLVIYFEEISEFLTVSSFLPVRLCLS